MDDNPYELEQVQTNLVDLSKATAQLQQAVEDGEIGIDDIHEHFGEEVGHAVDAMTRIQGESYFD